MKRVSILLGMVFVFLMFGSYALADCPDTIYYCHKNKGDGPSVGTVTFGNCFRFFTPEGTLMGCSICGGDYSRPTQECNRRYATQCEGSCRACPMIIKTGYLTAMMQTETAMEWDAVRHFRKSI